jgi:hypothetical protein
MFEAICMLSHSTQADSVLLVAQGLQLVGYPSAWSLGGIGPFKVIVEGVFR